VPVISVRTLFNLLSRFVSIAIFVSIDDHQYNAFIKLFAIMPHKEHVFIIKESNLKRESKEYKLSLIIDNLLNIERIKTVE